MRPIRSALGNTPLVGAEARRLLLLQGTVRFGPPDEPTRATIEGMSSIELLEPLSIRLLEVSSWHELLAPE